MKTKSSSVRLLISGVKLPWLRPCESSFIVLPGPFKSSSTSPQRTVTNIPRNIPSHWYQSPPLKAVPCGGTASVDGQSSEWRLLLLFPIHFFFLLFGVRVGASGAHVRGSADWVKCQMKLSVIGGTTLLTVRDRAKMGQRRQWRLCN